ncbi:MAG: hypothetical protein ACI4KH_02455 [Oscillospiraceae bacterium]
MGLPINVRDFVLFPMKKEETKTTEATYGTALSFTNRFMSFTDTPKMVSASINGDGATTNTYNSKNGGDLTVNIQKLAGEERVVTFGETKENDNSISSGSKDLIPYTAAVFKVDNDDGTIDLYKYPKLKCTEQPTSVEQKSENGIKYSTAVLKGVYMDLKNTDKGRYILENIDESTEEGKKIIADWYADGNPFSKAE